MTMASTIGYFLMSVCCLHYRICFFAPHHTINNKTTLYILPYKYHASITKYAVYLYRSTYFVSIHRLSPPKHGDFRNFKIRTLCRQSREICEY